MMKVADVECGIVELFAYAGSSNPTIVNMKCEIYWRRTPLCSLLLYEAPIPFSAQAMRENH